MREEKNTLHGAKEKTNEKATENTHIAGPPAARLLTAGHTNKKSRCHTNKKPNLEKKTREGEHIHALPPAAGRLGETARSEPPAGRAASKDPDEGDMAAEGEPPAVCVDRAAVAAGFDGCA